MEDVNIKILELKTNNLISKRQLAVNSAVVLIGGIVGLAFMPNGFLKCGLIVFGIFYAVVLIKEFLIMNAKIEKLLEWRKEN